MPLPLPRLPAYLVLFTVFLALTATSPTVANAVECTYADQGYRLENINAFDTGVTVRTGPSANRPAIAELPASARAVRCLGPCRDGWCRIRWYGVVGWIPRKHLADDGGVTWTAN